MTFHIFKRAFCRTGQILAVTLLAVMPLSAAAQVIDQNIIRVVPDYDDEITDSDFLEKTQPLREAPMGDKFLAYEMRMPLGWTKVDDIGGAPVENSDEKGVSTRVLGIVSKYYGPTRIDAPDFFQIEAMSLDYEMSVRNWFLTYIFTRGYSLQGMQAIGDKAVEAQYVTIVRDTPYVFRMLAVANGPRVLLITYAVPENHWQEQRAMQNRVIGSFRFLAPEDVMNQHTRKYAFLDLLEFSYPSSWRLIAPNIYSTEGMDAKLINARDRHTVNGEIDMRIISTELDTSLAEEVRYLKEDIKAKGLDIGDLIEVRDEYEYGDHILYDRVEIYKTMDDSRRIVDHELWLAVLSEDRYYYIVTMLTPGRNSDFFVWAKNTESFETVIESIAPPDDPYSYQWIDGPAEFEYKP